MTTLTQQDWECCLLALVLWREARGEDLATKRVVAWTIKNRVLHPSWWGRDWCSVIGMHDQYSSMTFNGDGNTVRWPQPVDTAWMACMDIATEVYNASPGFDVSGGSTHYFDKSLDDNPPGWAAQMTHVMDSGNFHLYKQ